MGHSQVEKAKTHDRIVAIAARRFREAGLDGLSIGDLMKEAGLTHGGFYKHFASREDLVVQAVTAALVSGSEIGKDGRAKAPPSYLDLIAYYLSERHRQDTGGGCAVSALLNDVARADTATRDAYTDRIRLNFQLLATLPGAPEGDQRLDPVIAFSVMVGALGLARAVNDDALSQQILNKATSFLTKP